MTKPNFQMQSVVLKPRVLCLPISFMGDIEMNDELKSARFLAWYGMPKLQTKFALLQSQCDGNGSQELHQKACGYLLSKQVTENMKMCLLFTTETRTINVS